MDMPSTSNMDSSEGRQPISRRPVRVNEPNYMDRIVSMLNEEMNDSDGDSGEDSFIDDSDADPDFILPGTNERENDGLSEFDNSSSSDNEEQPATEEIPQRRLPKYVFGRLRKTEFGPPYYWTTEEPRRAVRTPASNIVRGMPGLTASARILGNSPDRVDVWGLLFDKSMIQIIVNNTNVKLASVRERLGPNTEKSNYQNTNVVEINAYIGLLLFSSILKSANEKIESLFSKGITGRPVFTATMSAKRFEVLTSCLRFDDANSREERKSRDKAAAISEIFQMFVENSKKSYTVSEFLTVDEMLVPFRGRCSFKVYMPKKQKKIWSKSDVLV